MSHPNYKLGRVQQFDTKSLNFRVRSILMPQIPISREWSCDLVLDQGQTPSCVGHAHAHNLAATPYPIKDVTEDTAMQIYTLAQTLDGIVGPHKGTSVLAGIRAVQYRWPRAITTYHWGFGLEDVQQALSQLGPVVFGFNWYSSFYYPDTRGEIILTGNLEGGHAILGIGLDMENERVKLLNSWGPKWGVKGHCYIKFDVLERLLYEGGECCILTEQETIIL